MTAIAYSWQAHSTQPRIWSLAAGATPALGIEAADLLHTDPSHLLPLSGSLHSEAPATVSLVMRPPQVTVSSYEFPPRVDFEQKFEATPTPPPAISKAPPAGACRRYTRVGAPEDVIRLKDRLALLLEPPLELLLAGASLQFPAEPFPFQLDGVAFLYPRHAALLADEMGLGKTMQAITALRLLFHAREVRRALVVCPKPLVTNWRRELQAWAPEIPVVVIDGNSAHRRWQWRATGSALLVANYELLRRDAEIITAAPPFDLVVLDESQRIKNRSGATSQVVRSIPRSRSWALTGTPVENSPEDLVGIFDFLRPGHLSPTMKPRRMGRQAADYVLRRTKAQVLTDLPPKLFRDAELDLLPEQRESYRMAEDDGVLRLTALGDAMTIQHVFELVLRLKQICNFDPATSASAKLERLTADLEEVAASGQKALVFSQWVDTIDRLRKRLARFKPLEYHGRIPSAERDDVLREFRDDRRRRVLLLSYGAGGVGLNLQFASYVFLFDRWWNPAVEDQAVNRAHRIGAAGPVTVTRFLSPGTIEERIEQILRDKRELADAIFSETAAPRLGLSQEEIFGLFRLRRPEKECEAHLSSHFQLAAQPSAEA